MDVSEASRVLRAARRRALVACPVCGKVVEGLASRVYCTPYHRVLAWKRRQRGQPVNVYRYPKRRAG